MSCMEWARRVCRDEFDVDRFASVLVGRSEVLDAQTHNLADDTEEPGVVQAEIDEARSGDLYRVDVAKRLLFELRYQPAGELTGIYSRLLRGRERKVRRPIAMLAIGWLFQADLGWRGQTFRCRRVGEGVPQVLLDHGALSYEREWLGGATNSDWRDRREDSEQHR